MKPYMLDTMPSPFEHKKSLGQHFLNNSRVPERMAEAGNVVEGDTVLEIGPGTGALTRALLEKGARVIALETDHRAIEVLHETFVEEVRAQQLEIVDGDVRTMSLSTLHPALQRGEYKVIANIPYYLSGMLFRTFLESDTQPSDLVFLVQKEVAERITRDKKESLLSLSVKVYGEPHYVKTIKRGNFTPAPNVDSAIIAVRNISRKNFENVDEPTFFRLIHAGFKSKRKQLVSNLTELYPRAHILHTFSTLGIRPDVRGEDLDIDTWLTLAKSLILHT